MPTLNDKTYIDGEGKTCMIYCLKCKKENYIPAVSTGICAWCGYDANSQQKDTRDNPGVEVNDE